MFAGSRFRVGETYDELVDTKTGRRYASQEGGPSEGQSSQRDLGYFAAGYPSSSPPTGSIQVGGGQILPIVVAALIVVVVLAGLPLAVMRRRR